MTDIEGSTRLWEDAGDEMKPALTLHDRIVASAVQDNGGRLVRAKGEGDSTFSVFVSVSHALAAAISLQRALGTEIWSTPRPLKVRAAIHVGDTFEQDDDHFGPVANRCARLRAAAHGGQVLVSAPAAALASLPTGATLRDLGVHQLKDLSTPERVFQLCHPDIASDFTAPTTSAARTHNLPTELSSFVGRENQVEELAALTRTSRLVTLIGPGGVGKTRLALRVAAESLERFDAGVWFVDFTSISDDQLVVLHLAEALGIRHTRNLPILEALLERLDHGTQLVMLDGCEHLVDAVAKLADVVLRACPGLQVLATSRTPLAIEGETVLALPPLDLPDPVNATPSSLRDHEASRLFLERVSRADPRFSPDERDARGIAEICVRLEGLPLAIELAASRVRALSIGQIAERLRERFDLLSEGGRTAAARHKTLRATIEWSHSLLSELERATFRRLAVFAQSFPAEAVEPVCGEATFDPLLRLVEQSLVQRDMESSRFKMHEFVRQYGWDQLVAAGEERATVERHMSFFAALVDQVVPSSSTWDPSWAERVDADYDNIRAALGRDLMAGGSAVAVRMCTRLYRYWRFRGAMSEGRMWLSRVLEARPDGGVDRGRALVGLGSLALWQGDPSSAVGSLEEALPLVRSGDDPNEAAHAASTLGWAYLELHDIERAESLIGSLESAGSLNLRGEASRQRGDFEKAAGLYERALAAAEAAKDFEFGAIVAGNLALTMVALGRVPDARRLGGRWLPVARDTESAQSILSWMMAACAIASAAGDPAAAARLAGAIQTSLAFMEATLVPSNPDAVAIEAAERIARKALGNEELELLRADGAALTRDEAIALALTVVTMGEDE